MFDAGGQQLAVLFCCGGVPLLALLAFVVVQLARWGDEDDPDDPRAH